MSREHYTRYIVRSCWGDNDEDTGTASWYAHSIENAREQHELNFSKEKIIEITKCDEDHFDPIFDALTSS